MPATEARLIHADIRCQQRALTAMRGHAAIVFADVFRADAYADSATLIFFRYTPLHATPADAARLRVYMLPFSLFAAMPLFFDFP